MSLTGTVWADTVWADIWGPIWGAPQRRAAEQYSGGYFERGDRRTKKEIDELRQKLGILPATDDKIAQEVAELTNVARKPPRVNIEQSQEFDESAIAMRVAKVARSEREAAELTEISRLLARAEQKRQEEEFLILRQLWRLIS